MSYRAEAENHRDLYFDHLGARQLPEGFEIWLSLRTPAGERVLITTSVDGRSEIPTVSDLWAGAAWCEREAAEGFDLKFTSDNRLLLLNDEKERGYLLKSRTLPQRDQEWPGSFDPAGKQVKPLGASE